MIDAWNYRAIQPRLNLFINQRLAGIAQHPAVAQEYELVELHRRGLDVRPQAQNVLGNSFRRYRRAHYHHDTESRLGCQGYLRHDTDEELDALNAVYGTLGLLVNFRYPSVKLIKKTRYGSKVRRVYDQLQTPYQRMLQSRAVDAEVKARLKQQYETLNRWPSSAS